jgi:hypothetical protein
MSGTFHVPIPFTAVSAANVDLAELNAHATKPLILLEVNLYQSTELGDAAEEQLKLTIKTGHTSSGSGGNASTNAPATDRGAAVSGFGFETFNTTPASGGTIVTSMNLGWNVRGPLEKVFSEYSQVLLPAAGRMVLAIDGTPTDSITIGGYLVVQEVG